MSGRISQESVEKVKNAIDIVDVIGEYVILKKAGKDFKGLSPFTTEKTPSFFVVPAKNIFKDFSSGKAGDTFTFLKEKEGLSFVESIEFLARRYSIELVYSDVSEDFNQQQSDKEALRVIYSYATKFFHNNLLHTDEGKNIALAYFKQRGVPTDIIKKFELGYSLDQWTSLYDSAIKNGYSKDILVKSGLVKEKNKHVFDAFKGRIMFPILSPTGNTIAFGARTMKQDNAPKYINSSESPIYHKSKVIYGIFQAKDEIRNLDNCYITEGYMDVVSMHIAKVENAVAAAGTSLTTDQIKLIKRYTSNITMLFDGDRAGMDAMERGVKIAYAENCNIKIVILPSGEDPDSYAKKNGAQAFKQYLQEKVIDFVSFKIKLIENLIDEPLLKTKALQSLCEAIAHIPEQIARSTYVAMIATKLKYEESIIHTTVNKEVLKLAKLSERQKNFESQTQQTKSRNTHHDNSPSPIPIPPILDNNHSNDTPVWSEQNVPPPSWIPNTDDDLDKDNTYTGNRNVDARKSNDTITPIHRSNLEKIESYLEKDLIRLLIKFGRENVGDKYLCEYLYKEIEEYPLKLTQYQEIVEAYRTLPESVDAIEVELFSKFKDNSQIKQIIADVLVSNNKVSDAWEKYGIQVPKDSEILESSINNFLVKRRLTYVQKIVDDLLIKIRSTEDEEQIENIKIYNKYKELELELAKKIGTIFTR